MEHRHGWYQVAFQRNLDTGLNRAHVGSLRLVLWTDGYRVRAFRGDCPHRGADLGRATLEKGQITCPFHGYKIGVNRESEDGFRAVEYPTFTFGGGVLVRISDDEHCDVPTHFTKQFEDWRFTPVMTLDVAAPIETVVENGFDAAHFRAVHLLSSIPEFTYEYGEHREFIVRGQFEMPHPFVKNEISRASYEGRAFSPGFGYSSLQGDHYDHVVVTGATPTREHRHDAPRCKLFITYGFRKESLPEPWLFEKYVQATREGLELDRRIWESINQDASPQWVARDEIIVELHKFYRHFRGQRTEHAPSGGGRSGA